MSLTVHQDVRAAIRQILTGLSGIPSEFAWEGEKFTPTTGTAFLQEQLRPISSKGRGIGNGGLIEHIMTSNLVLFYPTGKGTLAIENAAAALMSSFARSTNLTYGTTSCRVMDAERAPLVQEPDWISCPVIVTINAFTAD